MILLPNGCHCSGHPGKPEKGIAPTLPVSPSNWKTSKASIKKAWMIHYRFYDPETNGMKQVIIKKMNKFKTLLERQDATQALMEAELDMLINWGYNPITGKCNEPSAEILEIEPHTPFIKALRIVKKKLNKAQSTLSDINSVINGLEKATDQLRISQLPIGQVSRKHIKISLDLCSQINPNWSPNRFNKYRSYLQILFNELMEIEAAETNPVSGIKKMKTVKKLRKTLSLEERRLINEHLRRKNYTFWRFSHMFFHSGSRETEMMLLKYEDVDLKNQRFKIIVNKGQGPSEEFRTIKDVILPLWQEVMSEAKIGDYLFSKNLRPGPVSISAWQITRRWRTHVKAPVEKGGLGITADFYSLKHSNLDETAEVLSTKDAARMAGHSSTVITLKHYLTGEEQRQHERLKKVNNSFS